MRPLNLAELCGNGEVAYHDFSCFRIDLVSTMRGDLVELVMELHDMGQSKLLPYNVGNLLCDSGPAGKLHKLP